LGLGVVDEAKHSANNQRHSCRLFNKLDKTGFIFIPLRSAISEAQQKESKCEYCIGKNIKEIACSGDLALRCKSDQTLI